MDSKLTVAIHAFDSIKKFGWCNIGHSHKDVVEMIKNTVENCGESFSVIEKKHSTQIIVKGYKFE